MQVFQHDSLFKDQLYCPASSCHQKAPSVKQQERPAFLRGAENSRPGAALHSIHSLQGQRQSSRCHNIFHTHFNPRIYQKEDDLILHPARLFHDDCGQWG